MNKTIFNITAGRATRNNLERAIYNKLSWLDMGQVWDTESFMQNTLQEIRDLNYEYAHCKPVPVPASWDKDPYGNWCLKLGFVTAYIREVRK